MGPVLVSNASCVPMPGLSTSTYRPICHSSVPCGYARHFQRQHALRQQPSQGDMCTSMLILCKDS